jgi:hypothetical protein
MATLDFTTYSGLQSAALNFIERPAETNEVKGWIDLAEARLNRKIAAVEVDTTLTGTSSSRNISVSSLSISRPVALKFVNDDGDESDLVMRSLASLSFLDDNGEPSEWAYDSDDNQLVLNRPLDAADTFRFIYREKFALSDSATTNWLLTNHPDLYLAATLIWGAAYREEIQNAVAWKAILDEGIEEVRREITSGKAGQLAHDPALLGKWPFRGVNLEGEI